MTTKAVYDACVLFSASRFVLARPTFGRRNLRVIRISWIDSPFRFKIQLAHGTDFTHGIQASGKPTFCRERFFRSHLRINLDMIRMRHREDRLIQVCFETQLPFVVDNTNVARSDRARYIELARQHKFGVVGYYFQSKIHDCLDRNENHSPEERIPKAGLLGASKRLELPRLDEGFDKLFYVQIDPETQSFLVEEWGGAET